MQNDYGYTHDPDGYLLLKITQLIELLGQGDIRLRPAGLLLEN